MQLRRIVVDSHPAIRSGEFNRPRCRNSASQVAWAASWASSEPARQRAATARNRPEYSTTSSRHADSSPAAARSITSCDAGMANTLLVHDGISGHRPTAFPPVPAGPAARYFSLPPWRFDPVPLASYGVTDIDGRGWYVSQGIWNGTDLAWLPLT